MNTPSELPPPATEIGTAAEPGNASSPFQEAPSPAADDNRPAVESGAPPSLANSPSPPSPASPDQKHVGDQPKLDAVLGTIATLSVAEQAEYMACEAVITMGWRSFVDVGLALARIREARLYRVEFDSFEVYCQSKWDYGRRYVNYLISAAQVITYLGTNSSLQKPEHETQVRPLVGLTPDQAQRAWEFAVEKAAGRRITARQVKAAMNELQLQVTPATNKPSRAKSQRRQLVTDGISELLALIRQNATQQTLLEKAQVLQWRIIAVFTNSKGTA